MLLVKTTKLHCTYNYQGSKKENEKSEKLKKKLKFNTHKELNLCGNCGVVLLMFNFSQKSLSPNLSIKAPVV